MAKRIVNGIEVEIDEEIEAARIYFETKILPGLFHIITGDAAYRRFDDSALSNSPDYRVLRADGNRVTLLPGTIVHLPSQAFDNKQFGVLNASLNVKYEDLRYGNYMADLPNGQRIYFRGKVVR